LEHPFGKGETMVGEFIDTKDFLINNKMSLEGNLKNFPPEAEWGLKWQI